MCVWCDAYVRACKDVSASWKKDTDLQEDFCLHVRTLGRSIGNSERKKDVDDADKELVPGSTSSWKRGTGMDRYDNGRTSDLCRKRPFKKPIRP